MRFELKNTLQTNQSLEGILVEEKRSQVIETPPCTMANEGCYIITDKATWDLKGVALDYHYRRVQPVSNKFLKEKAREKKKINPN
jgi:hypothetical protein